LSQVRTGHLASWQRHGKLADVYIVLYESLLSFYAGQRMATAHGHLYAVATLAAIAFINVASVVVLCAYLDFRWARELLLVARPWPSSVAVALGLLAAHLFLFRRRRSYPQPSKARQQQMRWVGMAYALLSVVIFLYISGLSSTLL
jgi:hypothetical protein